MTPCSSSSSSERKGKPYRVNEENQRVAGSFWKIFRKNILSFSLNTKQTGICSVYISRSGQLLENLRHTFFTQHSEKLLLIIKVQKRKKLVSKHQTKTGIWEVWETFRPVRGFFSLRFTDNKNWYVYWKLAVVEIIPHQILSLFFGKDRRIGKTLGWSEYSIWCPRWSYWKKTHQSSFLSSLM